MRITMKYGQPSFARDLRALLAGGDPLAEAPELSAETAAGIRRAVIAAAGRQPAVTSPWPRALAIASMVVVMIAGGAAIGGRLARDDKGAPLPMAQSTAQDERRQLQFATPGGTRIIWTLDPEFELERGTP